MLSFDIMYILILDLLSVSLISSVNEKIEAINKFFLYNFGVIQPLVALYEQKRMKWDSDRKKFRWLNGRSLPYPDYLKENMPIICPNNWVADQVKEIQCNQSLLAC